jgi:hypothetical protein
MWEKTGCPDGTTLDWVIGSFSACSLDAGGLTLLPPGGADGGPADYKRCNAIGKLYSGKGED